MCGVGDYASLLGQALEERHGIRSSFVQAGHEVIHQAGLELRLARLLPEAGAVLVHYSPYGYQKRAVPFALVRRLARIARQVPVITMFHELEASGPPTTSAFWLAPLQKLLIRRLAAVSSGVRTNRQAYAAKLAAWVPRLQGRVTAMPVFSNLGETLAGPGDSSRWGRLVAFASTVQPNQHASMWRVIKELSIRHLTWIGRVGPASPPRGLEVRVVPYLEPAEADSVLASLGVAFTGYNPEFLGKSGIFAAFASHALAVVLPEAAGLLQDGLLEDRQFLSLKKTSVSDVQLPTLGEGLRAWYELHSLEKTAASYAEQLQSLPNIGANAGARRE